MGLDGYVACDCVEKGKANLPESLTGLVKIDGQTGSPYLDSLDKRDRQRYSMWSASQPCPHAGHMLLHRRLGNAAGIGRIREILLNESHNPKTEFPVLWTRVLKSGVHSGDAIAVKQVADLQAELKRLTVPDGQEPFVWEFFARLEELVAASLSVDKPLGF